MLTFRDLTSNPKCLDEIGNEHVLIAAEGSAEVLIQTKQTQPAATMVFMHETIAMMKAERAEKLEKLRKQLGASSAVVPLRKKSGSFWDHVTLGRVSTADLVIDDLAVSNIHAHFLLDLDDAPVSVQDVGSSNGTFLNREPLQPHVPTPLSTGDCLRFGQSVFYFVNNESLRKLILGE